MHMNEPFIPMGPVGSNESEEPQFEPVESKSTELPADSERDILHRKPSVIVHRDGDHIQSIEVDCCCGRNVVLNCVYTDTVV